MRETNFASSEAQAIEIEPESIKTSLSLVKKAESELDFDDRESNSWIDALLRESANETYDFGRVKLDAARQLVVCDGRYARFAPLDFALLLVMVRHKNKTLSHARICRQVWGPNRKISVPRLRVRVFRVRQRLEEELMDGIHIISRGGLGYMVRLDGNTRQSPASRKALAPRPPLTAENAGPPRFVRSTQPPKYADAAE